MSDARDKDRISMMRLRRGIGAIGIGLPITLLLGVWLADVPMQNSISEFFFTDLREVFVAAATGVGLFLLAYEGYPKRLGETLTDRQVSGIAGASVLTMAMVPAVCDQLECYRPLSLFDRLIPETSDQLQSAIHLGAAGVFLFCMGLVSARLFTRCTRPDPKLHKRRRNTCYQVFGWTIFTMVGLIGIMKLVLPDIGNAWDATWHFTFWAESIALWAFGLSWLMKGEILSKELPFLFGADT